MKKLGLILLIAALVLTGCAVTRNISGRGSVAMSYVIIGFDEYNQPIYGQPGDATFSLNYACYAQNNNRLEGNLKWNDPINGVQVSATLPETSVRAFTNGMFTTCKAMKAAASTLGFSLNTAGIYSEDGNANGDAGTLTGIAVIVVAEPGVPLPPPDMPLPIPLPAVDCGPEGTTVFVGVQSQQIPIYMAEGCLDRGKIVFGTTQNQQ